MKEIVFIIWYFFTGKLLIQYSKVTRNNAENYFNTLFLLIVFFPETKKENIAYNICNFSPFFAVIYADSYSLMKDKYPTL